MSPTFINIADLPAGNGKTYRENNLAKTHGIPVGALVEIEASDEEDRQGGVRVFVTQHNRDCDGTPLYSLSMDSTEICWNNEQARDGYGISTLRHAMHGYSEESLKVVSLPQRRA